RLVGGLLIVGFDGTTPSSAIRRLIEEHAVGVVLLASKNLQSAEQTLQLILDLQQCALAAGHKRPLLIAIDQENGHVNSLAEDTITQFPPAMAIAAIDSLEMARDVGFATGNELASLGFNWIMGPVLDVLSSERAQPLGVRAFSDDSSTVALLGMSMVEGFHRANLACSGKHFPSYGDVDFSQGSSSGNLVLSQPIEKLYHDSFLPFIAAIQGGIDSLLVGAGSLEGLGEVMPYACLSETIVTKVLRHSLDFNGVTVSECLSLEGVFDQEGIGKRAVEAVKAGCDLVMVCHNLEGQETALAALQEAVSNGTIAMSTITAAANRVAAMKDKRTSWQRALNPPGVSVLRHIQLGNEVLSQKAYRASISLVRDYSNALSSLRNLNKGDRVLLLTPLLESFPSTATRSTRYNTTHAAGCSGSSHLQLAAGEDVFQSFGSSLAQKNQLRVLHTSYSSNGIRPHHEQLISQSAAVIVITADASRNTYQYGVSKYVNLLCKTQKYQRRQDGDDPEVETNQGEGWMNARKPAIFVAVSSPWDLLLDPDIDTYICTYDYSRTSLETLAEFFF
ncbi:glycoside hydrolase superfamily, partial [Xylogone sp. PMI_703]